jgi:hypothetical protein
MLTVRPVRSDLLGPLRGAVSDYVAIVLGDRVVEATIRATEMAQWSQHAVFDRRLEQVRSGSAIELKPRHSDQTEEDPRRVLFRVRPQTERGISFPHIYTRRLRNAPARVKQAVAARNVR